MGGFAKTMNKIPAVVLRSPLHPLMGGKYLLLTFAGRKSGRRYTTPVAYLREGDVFLMTTDSPWWKNLRGGAPVALWVKGQESQGIGEAVTYETEVVRVLGRFLEAQPGYAKYVGLKPRYRRPDRPSPDKGDSPREGGGASTTDTQLGDSGPPRP